jgi:dipeptidyl aminopeptidase/acylaminoacyl peptidase
MRRYRLAVAIITVFVVIVASLSAAMWTFRPTHAGLTTAFIMPDLFVDLPVSPLKLTGERPLKEEVTFAANGRQVSANLYRPDDNDRHGAVLVVIGAAPRALEDEQVVRLAKSVARAGLVVMLPELDHLLADEMVPEEIDEVVGAFQYLRAQPFVDPERTGMLGFSVGAGVGLVAASDPRISDQVALFGSFGGYYDLYDVITAATTETITNDDHQTRWEPDDKTLRVLRRSLIYYVDDPRDQDVLTRIFLEDDDSARQELDGLSPRSRAIFDILDNRDPARSAELFAALPSDYQTILRRLSPSAALHGLRAELIVMHDRHDRYIPYTESRRLAEAARSGVEVHYAEMDIFRHVDPRVPPNPLTFLANLIELLFQVCRLMLRLS